MNRLSYVLYICTVLLWTCWVMYCVYVQCFYTPLYPRVLGYCTVRRSTTGKSNVPNYLNRLDCQIMISKHLKTELWFYDFIIFLINVTIFTIFCKPPVISEQIYIYSPGHPFFKNVLGCVIIAFYPSLDLKYQSNKLNI